MARKKKGLPFVVQPRLEPIKELIGTEESGQIYIERRGYLTVGEKSIVQGASMNDTTMTDAFAVARSIARKEDLSADEVFKAMVGEGRDEYIEKYPEEIMDIANKMAEYEERNKLVAATAMLMSRVDPDWEPKQTVTLHPDLIEALYELYLDESKKSTEALEAAMEHAENKTQDDAEGKE